jgi:hypothetical protein
MNSVDLQRFHDAAKMIEYDGDQAYRTCCERFGSDIAGVLLVAFLRRAARTEEMYPEPEDLREKVNEYLRKLGLIDEICPFCGGDKNVRTIH